VFSRIVRHLAAMLIALCVAVGGAQDGGLSNDYGSGGSGSGSGRDPGSGSGRFDDNNNSSGGLEGTRESGGTDRTRRTRDRERARDRNKQSEEERKAAANENTPQGAAPRGVGEQPELGRTINRASSAPTAAAIESRAPAIDITFEARIEGHFPVLYFKPIVVDESGNAVPAGGIEGVPGEVVRTDLMMHNPRAQRADRILVAFRYDPELLRLTVLDPRPLLPFLRKEPLVRFDAKEGRVILEAVFSEPVLLGAQPLAILEWKLLQPGTMEIRAENAQGSGDRRPVASGIYSKGLNILGQRRIQNDGIVPLTVNIERANNDDPIAQAESLSGFVAKGLDPAMVGRGGRGGIELAFEPEKASLKAGEEMNIAVRWTNPYLTDIDLLKLEVRVDPALLQLVDSDKGNATRLGANWLQGNRRAFPFDYNVENSLDPKSGRGRYIAGMMQEAALPEDGIVATIRVRALPPPTGRATKTNVLWAPFEGGDFPSPRGTQVLFLGRDMLGTADDHNDGLVSASVTVEP